MKDIGLFQYSVMLIIAVVLDLDEMAQYFLLLNNTFFKSQIFKRRIFLQFFQSFWKQDDVLCVAYNLNVKNFPSAWVHLKTLLHTCSILHLLELSGRRVKTLPMVWDSEKCHKQVSWEVERYILRSPHISSLCIRTCPVLVLFYFVLLCGSLPKDSKGSVLTGSWYIQPELPKNNFVCPGVLTWGKDPCLLRSLSFMGWIKNLN